MTDQSSQGEIKYRVAGMDCANCALVLERSLGQVDGVQQVQVSFSTSTLTASGDFDPQVLVGRVEALGYHALPYHEEDEQASGIQAPDQRSYDGVIGFLRFLAANRQTAIALWGAVLLLLSIPLGFIEGWEWVQIVLQVGVVVMAGLPIANKGIRALLIGKQITIDLLMSIAVAGALLIGETGEAATVILLFSIGEALESYTAERARRSLRGLLALKPDQATVLRPCLDCAEHLGQEGYMGGPCPFCGMHENIMPVEQVQLGEVVIVRPGERIPVDGIIRSGSSSINQAPVTGESTPVSKGPGDEVFAGTLNGEAALEVSASRVASDSTISRIVRLVEQAQAQRAPIERFIDRFAAWYTPAVVLLAAALAILPPLLWGAPFLDQPDGTHGWLYRALALLIVACPCALVISTPVTVASALSSLARVGVLVKGGAFLEALAGTTTFAFDKTGTLTLGKPLVTQVRTIECTPDNEYCEACDEMLAIATAVERRSEHPLAKAILAEAETRNLLHVYPAAEDVQALAGRGVQGKLNGMEVLVGSHSLFHERSQACEHLHEYVQQAEAEGQTVMLISRDNQTLGFVSIADVLRETSQQALAELKAIDPRLHTVMLTGDNSTVAEKIAALVGNIDEVRAGLLPEDKLQAVIALKSRAGGVVMVGDGVNDAPALAAATVGVAMGGAGSAQAMETADVVLMQSNLTHLPGALRSSRKARRIIYQNITFSLVIKAIFLLLTLLGQATLWMAVFADMGASLLVILNGMRMLDTRNQLPPKATLEFPHTLKPQS